MASDHASDQNCNGDSTPAVDGAVGTDEEAAVDKPVELDILERYFDEPACHGKQKKDDHKHAGQQYKFLKIHKIPLS